MSIEGFKPQPNSMWLVVYEYRYDIVRVSADGKGFFAPGQEPCWSFDCVSKWIKEIVPPAVDGVEPA